jgi:hypothetical protein
MTDVVERYLRLGLQLGRHVDGIVDSYFGPPELAAEVEAAPPVDPQLLVAEADALLETVDDGWLRDQLGGLRTYAGVLAGARLPYADETEGCYGVRPTWTDESVFAAAHEQLEELLPGQGSLPNRMRRFEESLRVPAERIESTVAQVIEVAREQTRRFVELPTGEGVELEIVRDVPWLGYCEYLGDFRSRISVNVDMPWSAGELLGLALHETYPGHHAERSAKDQLLVRDRGLLEETLVTVPTPQSLISEGIAKLAPMTLLDGEGGSQFADVVRAAELDFDLAHVLAFHKALEPLEWASVNASLLLHERGADEADVRAYLERWELISPERAEHAIRFYSEHTSRTYVVTYAAGLELARAYVGDDPGRFGRLLTEQVRVGDLVAARSAAA